MRLTAKQRLFADEYIKSGNATQSYIKAGYSVKSDQAAATNGGILLRNHKVKAYIEVKMAEIESHKIADAKEVLQFYTRVLRKEETEPEKLMDEDGSERFYEREPSLKDRLTAAKEIMKRYPLSNPVVQAQLKKLQADTRISEAKAKSMEDNGQDMELLLDKMLDTITKEDKKDESK